MHDPFKIYEQMLRQMQREMMRADEQFLRLMPASPVWQPSVDVYETVDAIKIKVELAGCREEDVSVDVHAGDRQVVIRGRRRDAREAIEGNRVAFHHMEIYVGPFERVVQLPEKVQIDPDDVAAHLKDGMLCVTVPKRAPVEAKRRTVPVER
jgi:HSP20 family protein